MDLLYGRVLWWLLLLSSVVTGVAVTPDSQRQSSKRQVDTALNRLAYAPKPAVCPATPLLRTANGLGSQESAWFRRRKSNADAALRTWLSKFGSFPASSMPTVGSAVAGGFLRASMLGAGIHQQLDASQGRGPMAGLLQAISYEATLSGSVAYQMGLMQNNWPSISSLSTNLWQPNYAQGMNPGASQGQAGSGQAIASIAADVGLKSAASYPTTLLDIFGRIIAYSHLYGDDGGVTTTMSGTRDQSKFASAQVPLPIFTATGTKNQADCFPGNNGSQYEMTPFEFGSWDPAVNGFMDMKYLGTRMLNGRPLLPNVCTTGFDNLGYLAGASSNVLGFACLNLEGTGNGIVDNELFTGVLDQAIGLATSPINRGVYAPVPNPFFGLGTSPGVSGDTELNLVDGGNTGQVIPLWPLLKRSNVDVIFTWDNYYDLLGTGTTGNQIHNTYVASQTAKISRMPVIPTADEFKRRGLNTKPGAFGCNSAQKVTLIYVPYQAYLPQTQKTSNLTTTPQQTRDYITNGNRLATNNNNSEWPRCVACLVMKKKSNNLPSFCGSCFSKYCYN